ncbi:MAG TPA: DUF805 domain-containing protein [Burkholderiales bacterium]|nr:DUF805 domain-containing protein [Burkholderiales bacterium]
MAVANPYQGPRAAVADSDEAEYQSVRIFGAAGRIGRVRYIAYTVGLPLLIVGLAALVGAVLDRALGVGVTVPLVIGAYAAVILAYILLTIQRCHDFDVSGWLSIVFILVPFAVLLLWIIPGTKAPNRYGPPTEPNSTLAVIGALVLPFVFVAGILAAVAIPAYQDYVKRAQQAGQRR